MLHKYGQRAVVIVQDKLFASTIAAVILVATRWHYNLRTQHKKTTIQACAIIQVDYHFLYLDYPMFWHTYENYLYQV